MNCLRCGFKNPSTVGYCLRCGAKLRPSAEEVKTILYEKAVDEEKARWEYYIRGWLWIAIILLLIAITIHIFAGGAWQEYTLPSISYRSELIKDDFQPLPPMEKLFIPLREDIYR
jgi:hypothetical protein